ncbi:sugar ABC transporter ATP-binding protein [Subtercola lobariae]|uniref:Ribose import ATP-binding protein RbsA n=1 Tax=Subtercola lobariae TaxID=1588641 RepID=A0A917ETK7_9MICO|nr:sugar ABC transporter ATP-binding protein [Subtercola lobariae]GGF10266.1 ribose import ATP-binding protein RbsA [Subtercola lobariae]
MITESKAAGGGDRLLATPAVRLRNLSKTFGTTTVLHQLDLDIAAGETRGLVGENGSGKSTLIKILAGFHQPDHGAEIEIGETRLEGGLTPLLARELGLTFVHQDLALVTSLSVSDNMTMNALAASPSWRVSPKAELRATQTLLDSYELGVDARAAVSSLTQLQRAMVAIVRAIDGVKHSSSQGQSSLLVLDEPTVFLPKTDRTLLFDLARRHTNAGGCVLFVSHDLEECLEVTDTITVLRDGRLQGTLVSNDSDRADIIRMMVGKELNVVSHRRAVTPSGLATAATASTASAGSAPAAPDARPSALTVRELSDPAVHGISFDIAQGEVVGLTGLLGSGFEEVPYLVAGAGRGASGTIAVAGREFRARSLRPIDAIEAGIALIPGDRARQGSVSSLSVLDNISVQSLRANRRRFVIDWKGIRAASQQLITDYDVRPPKLDATYGTLSGGNQQKVMLAKWMQTGPKVVLLHEPTQGVDIGAREQIFDIVRAGADAGAGVLCASADQEQLALLCDRVLVMRDGSIVAELVGDDITKAAIASASLGSAPRSTDRSDSRKATRS